MKFKDLIRGVEGVRLLPGERGLEIRGLAEDSRKVKKGDLFAALPSASGRFPDRAAYEAQALHKGAAAVLRAEDPRRAWAELCFRFNGHPERALKLAAVTGTNGKTTTSFLLKGMLERAGRKSALVGTVAYYIGKRRLPAPNTTPGSLELAGLLAMARKSGAKAAVMEASSHALDQKRVDGCRFDAAVFTNLTQDHLDYHRTMQAYLRAKTRLFRLLKARGAAVVNMDDKAWKAMAAARTKGSRLVRFSAAGNPQAELRASKIRFSARETRFDLLWKGRAYPVRLPLPGRFNVENCLGAAGAALGLGLPPAAVMRGLARPQLPPGRFQLVKAGQDYQVVVDYAHTPDALERLLKAAREVTPGRIVTVFGCGGDRDRGKRPKMGAIAARLSDLAIATSDNPRSEDAEKILDDIFAGIKTKKGSLQTVLRLADRRMAIRRAVKLARPGDTVILAGKGHEDYQILPTGRIHFSDVEEARRAIKDYKELHAAHVG